MTAVSIATSAAAVTALAAQEPLLGSLPIRLGVEVGANFAHVSGSTVSDISNRTGVLAGGTIEVGLANGWSVESGVQYSMKGWRRIDPQSNDRADVNIDYIEVPVQLRYEIRNTSRFTPYLSGGAGVSFRSTCTIGLTDGATGASSSTSCSDAARLSGGTFEFGPTDVGVLVGAGALIRAGAAAAQLGVRYEHGLLAEQQRTDIKGRLVSLTAGVSWPLGF